jgi:hypothetical protein
MLIFHQYLLNSIDREEQFHLKVQKKLLRIAASTVTVLHLKEEQYSYMNRLLAPKLVIVTAEPTLYLSALMHIVKKMANVSILLSHDKHQEDICSFRSISYYVAMCVVSSLWDYIHAVWHAYKIIYFSSFLLHVKITSRYFCDTYIYAARMLINRFLMI